MYKKLQFIGLLVMGMMQSGCSPIPEEKNKIKIPNFDYGLTPKLTPKVEESPEKYDHVFYQSTDLVINEETDVSAALMEMANNLGIDIAIGSKIPTGINICFTDKPFIEIVDTLCDMLNLAYKIQGKSIMIQKDDPYIKHYNLPFLNRAVTLSRNNFFSNNQKNSRNLSASKESNNSDNSGSQFQYKVSNDLWQEIDLFLKHLVIHNNYSIHKEAGLITVKATQKHHKEIENYVNKIKKSLESQVLIEAQVISVKLNSHYKNGINWGKFLRDHGDTVINESITMPFVVNTLINSESIVSYLQEYGNVKSLSNPRMTVTHNQPAVLSVAKNEVYFSIRIEQGSRVKKNKKYDYYMPGTACSEVNILPVGFTMIMHPVVNAEKSTITINLHPIISRIAGYRPDPLISVMGGAIPAEYPLLDIAEMDSSITLRSGETAVLGGILQENSSSSNSTSLFSMSRDRRNEVNEFIFLIKATIVN